MGYALVLFGEVAAPALVVGSEAPPDSLSIRSQVSVADYRADFVIGYAGRRAVVECDGHDFHERTKRQARRDRKRDRDLQAAGYAVLRFTGSEIWGDVVACAREALLSLEVPGVPA